MSIPVMEIRGLLFDRLPISRFARHSTSQQPPTLTRFGIKFDYPESILRLNDLVSLRLWLATRQ